MSNLPIEKITNLMGVGPQYYDLGNKYIQLVNISNIYQWQASHIEQDQDSYEALVDQLVIDLPWPVTWFEARNPKYALTKNGWVSLDRNQLFGCLAFESAEKLNDVFTNEYHIFLTNTKDEGMAWLGSAQVNINKEIHYKINQDSNLSYEKPGSPRKPLVGKDAEKGVWERVKCVLHAVNFCHLKKSKVTKPSAKRRREHYSHKIDKSSSYDYKMLEIGGDQEIVDIKSIGSDYGGTKKLHICRGHFKTYTEDNPLFGQPGNTGQVWIPMHTRGSAKKGEVRKAYKVNPKED